MAHPHPNSAKAPQSFFSGVIIGLLGLTITLSMTGCATIITGALVLPIMALNGGHPVSGVGLRSSSSQQKMDRQEYYVSQNKFWVTAAERDAEAWVKEHPEDAAKTDTFRRHVKAAAQGDANAELRVGYCYYTSLGVNKSNQKARVWFQNAAEKGLAVAQINLGICYHEGIGVVRKDDVTALKWFRAAAEQGEAYARNRLGAAYYLGEGVLKDDGKAFEWYLMAAQQGDPASQAAVGDCYAEGIGVKMNMVEAYAYYGLASRTFESCRKKLALLDAKLSPAERQHAQQLTKERREALATK